MVSYYDPFFHGLCFVFSVYDIVGDLRSLRFVLLFSFIGLALLLLFNPTWIFDNNFTLIYRSQWDVYSQRLKKHTLIYVCIHPRHVLCDLLVLKCCKSLQSQTLLISLSINVHKATYQSMLASIYIHAFICISLSI